MPKNDPVIRHSVQRRLEFIEFRLFWEGQINRSDLVDAFGISVPQASADLRRYQELKPRNISYDSHKKAYLPNTGFVPIYLQPSGDSYLARLRLRETGYVDEGETWAAQLPDFSVVPILRRSVDANSLRLLLRAVRESLELKIKYQSVRANTPNWRWIAPHALGFDGFRWHARAWCARRRSFRDFVLSRVIDVGEQRSADIETGGDTAWHCSVSLILKPHPKLSAGARRAVELDFGMVDGRTTIETRVCLSFYLERHLGLDLDPNDTSPDRQRIVLANRDEVDAAREAIDREAANAG